MARVPGRNRHIGAGVGATLPGRHLLARAKRTIGFAPCAGATVFHCACASAKYLGKVAAWLCPGPGGCTAPAPRAACRLKSALPQRDTLVRKMLQGAWPSRPAIFVRQAFLVQALHQPVLATCLPANNGQPPALSPGLP